MQISPAALEAMYYGFDSRFNGAFERTPAWYDRIATQVPSTTKANRYHWMDLLPRMREWVGERVVQNLVARAFAIENKSYELTVEVDRDDIEDDNLGVYNGWVDTVAQQARKWPDDLLATLLQAGGATLCADGQYFFDTDHPVNADNSTLGTYSNLFTSTALTAANYGTVRSTMMARNGADSKPLKVNPGLLVVPPALEFTARAILNSEIIAPGAAWAGNAANTAATNVYRNTADLLVIPELNNEPTVWYLLDVSRPLRPFIFQLRKAPEFVALFSPTDPNVFWRKKYVYGVDTRGNAGFTMPFLAARCVA
jgi:phage major head subunit gpT-like protein